MCVFGGFLVRRSPPLGLRSDNSLSEARVRHGRTTGSVCHPAPYEDTVHSLAGHVTLNCGTCMGLLVRWLEDAQRRAEDWSQNLEPLHAVRGSISRRSWTGQEPKIGITELSKQNS
eukprot:1341246-Amphidinium_carterae.1